MDNIYPNVLPLKIVLMIFPNVLPLKIVLENRPDDIPKRVVLENRPDDIDKIWWEKFVDIEYSDKKEEQCKKNAENKAKNPITHTLGQKSYSRMYEEMAKENPEGKISRVEAWKRAHTKRKTGEVLPCAVEKYDLIEAAEERQKLQARDGSDGIVSLEEFESDPITEVFGPERKKSYCRAVSSTSSVKQVKMTQASKAIASQKDVQDLRSWKMEIQNQVTDAINLMTASMNAAFMNMQQNMLQNVNMQQNQCGGNVTPRTEVASNTQQSQAAVGSPDVPTDNVASPNIPTNNVGSSYKGKKYVMLLSRDLKEVAKGYLATRTICHQRKVVQDGESVFWVTESGSTDI